MIEHSALAVAVAESNWAFAAIETVHVIALTLVIGTVAVIDLRLLGLASAKQPYVTLRHDVLPWTWAAFAVAVTSGTLMFLSQAVEYSGNVAFRVKAALLLLAGINMLVFELAVGRHAAEWDHGASIPRAGKIAAFCR